MALWIQMSYITYKKEGQEVHFYASYCITDNLVVIATDKINLQNNSFTPCTNHQSQKWTEI